MIHKWWHRFVRKRTKPIPVDTAILWKRRLSIAYGLLAWNAFGLVLYSSYKGKADWAHYYGIKTDEEYSTPPGEAWANTLGIKSAKVYRIAGLKKVDEYDIVDGHGVRTKKEETAESQETLNE
ncbi:uncharacterized protein LOC110373475 [Helicoverpa armigera]|uniref:uncharacterized protein LOC110373475 n=1 Tax=Helicoverpa armigera TaxID=29058 RepID=UPI000B3747BF|nr:uncharacterized protein LOC110373475 [Helicoverpa armigera]XP_047033456.1 uncharacterized protein LOC124639966 [Helicoverpa zea]XP_047033457.1 uncharacterized protein LOC124639966 [Helicoverpa zea]XP_047033458.1 uncharacterized protein LOC124639966 [Helicoverpa zea]XP_049704609.1 uncharacterized protein LOC110373475 [Helicoverpa armigera]PZC80892.1 hypothetical protein B5X24_HaOG213879 [Helicoverpa armigera]